MHSVSDKYQVVIGLEVHAQLSTQSKIFNTDSTEFGNMPNTNLSVITLAHPGILPKLNKKVVEYAIKMGLACKCDITQYQFFDRKQYFYPDLPKGYQTTQDKTPICRNGGIKIKLKDGSEKTVKLTKIHMEEDAGKSMHLDHELDSLVDLNRAGVPLIEIVTEPDIRNAEEAYVFLNEVRKLVRYLDICDGNMEEGSMRCDVNISLMLKDATEFGKKVEVKNLNSFRNVTKAIELEIIRQTEILERGEEVMSETRTFDTTDGQTYSLRSKEELNDYRYFPEPDLQPFEVSKEWLEEVRAMLPSLPNELVDKFVNQYQLPEYDAFVLTETKEIALYFDELCKITKNYKAASNWIMGPVKSYLNELTLSINDFPVKTVQLADLIALVDSEKVSHSTASQRIYPEMLKGNKNSAESIAQALGVIQVDNVDFLKPIIEQVLAKYPDKVEEYKKGKKGVLGLFMGDVMKLAQGKANPQKATEMLKTFLD